MDFQVRTESTQFENLLLKKPEMFVSTKRPKFLKFLFSQTKKLKLKSN